MRGMDTDVAASPRFAQRQATYLPAEFDDLHGRLTDTCGAGQPPTPLARELPPGSPTLVGRERRTRRPRGRCCSIPSTSARPGARRTRRGQECAHRWRQPHPARWRPATRAACRRAGRGAHRGRHRWTPSRTCSALIWRRPARARRAGARPSPHAARARQSGNTPSIAIIGRPPRCSAAWLPSPACSCSRLRAGHMPHPPVFAGARREVRPLSRPQRVHCSWRRHRRPKTIQASVGCSGQWVTYRCPHPARPPSFSRRRGRRHAAARWACAAATAVDDRPLHRRSSCRCGPG